MWIGFADFDFLLGDVSSLKEKRSVVRPIVADIRKRFAVSVAEVGHLDKHRRAEIGVSVVAADRAHVDEVLSGIERAAAGRPEVELLSVRQRIIEADDI
ncbi:DUF503 domain-containing protein [Gordonia soli]|uniref:YlxP-like protein n=1 Tax=Gordonia soli NBRC 108243 TaxID=1223545 RepID=M0QM03_9ACTN|nr:DUF503 domain-containing protein [Gordonia soli]GAC69700.1 hypothetical protein GS4_26_01480 [Gordonia soli NBRC 108243]